jgi:hypothetical protein
MRHFPALAGAAGLVVVAVFLPKALFPEAPLYRDWLTEAFFTRFGALSKLVFLAAALVFSHRAASSFDEANAARLPWRFLSVGLFAFLLGQSYLAFVQVVLGQPSPYPSPADAAFMMGYPFFVACFWLFIRAYREAGFPVGTAAQHVRIGSAAALGLAAIGVVALGPVLQASVPGLERALNLAYPVFDLLILVPVSILLRITFAFRGGRLWTIWAAILAGFISMGAGDILYAYFVTLGHGDLEPIVDALYTLAYVFLALGCARQYQLSR